MSASFLLLSELSSCYAIGFNLALLRFHSSPLSILTPLVIDTLKAEISFAFTFFYIVSVQVTHFRFQQTHCQLTEDNTPTP